MTLTRTKILYRRIIDCRWSGFTIGLIAVFGIAMANAYLPTWWDTLWNWQNGVPTAALIGFLGIGGFLQYSFASDRDEKAARERRESEAEERVQGDEIIQHERRVDLRLLYQDCLDNIRDLKRQQWTVTYYALLLYAAIGGAYNLVKDRHLDGFQIENWLPYLLVVFGFISVTLILRAQFALRGRRVRLHYIREHYFDDVVELLPGSNKPNHIKFRYNWELWGMMILTIIVGAILAVMVVYLLASTACG